MKLKYFMIYCLLKPLWYHDDFNVHPSESGFFVLEKAYLSKPSSFIILIFSVHQYLEPFGLKLQSRRSTVETSLEQSINYHHLALGQKSLLKPCTSMLPVCIKPMQPKNCSVSLPNFVISIGTVGCIKAYCTLGYIDRVLLKKLKAFLFFWDFWPLFVSYTLYFMFKIWPFWTFLVMFLKSKPFI